MNNSARHRLTIAALVAIVALTATSCAASTDTAPTPSVAPSDLGPADFSRDAEGVTVGLASLWESNPTVKLFQDAYAAAAAARGAEANVLQADPQDPVDSLIGNLDTIISLDVDVAGFYPIDPNALTAPTVRATEAGIPVVSAELTDAPVTAMVHQARTAAAVTVAQAVCDLLPDGGKIIYGDYGYSDPSVDAYGESFRVALAECSDGAIDVAETFENRTDDIAGAIDPALAALQRVPEATAIVAYSDVTAIGASRAATQLGVRDGLTIFGLNLATDGVEALRSGVIDYSLYAPLALMGQYIANLMIDIALGESVPRYSSFWLSCYGTAEAGDIPSPEEQTALIAAGVDLLTDPELQVATSDDAVIVDPPAGIKGCVV